MKEKNCCIDCGQLRKAKIKLTMDYTAVVLNTAGLALISLLFLMSGNNTEVFMNRLMMLSICIGLSYGSICLYKITSNWDEFVMVQRAKKKVKTFEKNFSYLIREEYGVVTNENVEAVRKIACSLYALSTGDTSMNKMHYATPEFFNRMILNDAEYMAMYGEVIGLGNKVYSL